MWFTNSFIILTFVNNVFAQKIFFGGVFDDLQEEDNTSITDQQAFEAAVFLVNKLRGKEDFEIEALVEEPDGVTNGPFMAKSITCSLISKQALVIFGPKKLDQIDMVRSICDSKDVAHIITKWMYNPSEHSMVNFYPHYTYLTIAYLSILKAASWKSFTLFYEDDESMLRLGDFLNFAKNEGIIVTVKQFDEVGEGIYRTTLKDAVHSGEKNFVFDCNINILSEVLRQAQQVGLMTGQYNFFITNLDLQTIDLEPFQYSEANITGIRILNPERELAVLTINVINKMFNQSFDVAKMKTETALLIDAVSLTAHIINTKLSLQDMELQNISCDSLQSSRLGDTISNHIKTSHYEALTGLVEFDGGGFRHNFNLEIIEIVEDGIIKVGTWNSSKGLVMSRSVIDDVVEESDSLKNKTFKVITCLTDPYCMLKETSVQLFGNDRFEGFAIDLINELAKMEGFNYTFIIREDKKNGDKNDKTGDWSGMIGDVMVGTADLAIADMTITADREQAVDFTSPFMNLGISILAKKPGNAPPSFFSFADPFAFDTWLGLAIAYIVVSLSFFIMGRLCQDEWTNPYPCIEEPEYLINQFSLTNSGWFAVGSLMQQGTELGPIAVSTRMVSAMWWFFVLIIVSSYTANLAAFLATENPIVLFSDVNSLIANKDKYSIRMGAKKLGATEGFFKGKDDEIYTQIYEYMQTHPEDMVRDNKDGVQLAIEENYAFFMESTSIEYETQRHCELQQYGKLLDDKGYGIAMRKNSTYRKKLSTAILKLQSNGEIDKLKRKWWEEKRGGGQCLAGGGDDEETPPLGVQNVQGVFYVTIGGTVLAIFIAIAEILIATYKLSQKTRIPFKKVLQMEFKSFMDFNSDVKPTLKASSKSGSKSSKQSGLSNNNSQGAAAPYGFIPEITKEELQD